MKVFVELFGTMVVVWLVAMLFLRWIGGCEDIGIDGLHGAGCDDCDMLSWARKASKVPFRRTAGEVEG